MALNMKERYARLDMSKLPDDYKKQFDTIQSSTENFADEDLNEIFAENFNDLYALVESNHPSAIHKGGTIKKEKPAKVKVVRAKKTKSEKEFELPKKIENEIRGKLSNEDIEFIESTLRNDEESTDQELIDHFVTELDIPETRAKKWVALRDKYLTAPVEKALSYSERTRLKKESRNASGADKPRRKLSEQDIMDIEGTIAIANEEKHDDAMLMAMLIKDFNISKKQAEKWVKSRGKYKGDHPYGDYHYRKEKKKDERESKNPNIVKTRDGYTFNRKDPKNKGLKFFDENGKQWECVRYDSKLDECILKDNDGKEISSCLREMYVNNPVEKREKGNLVDDCKDTLKKAGYSVKEHKAGSKKISRKEPRPERDIIKERVGNTFTPILKDISNSEEKKKENKDVISALGRVEVLIVKFFNRLNNLAEDGKASDIEKIEKLLKELVD